MLTDHQIIQLSKKMNIPIGGVFFKDEMPTKLDVNKAYFVNLQDSTNDDGEDNEGTHWTFLQVAQYPKGKIEPIYFDPFGHEPSEILTKIVKDQFGLKLPHTDKDVQSMMNNACGFYCLALGHFINASKYRSNDLYTDVGQFLEMFDDLNTSCDFKKNEYILQHFFQAEDPSKRRSIDVIKPLDSIRKEDHAGGIDIKQL